MLNENNIHIAYTQNSNSTIKININIWFVLILFFGGGNMDVCRLVKHDNAFCSCVYLCYELMFWVLLWDSMSNCVYMRIFKHIFWYVLTFPNKNIYIYMIIHTSIYKIIHIYIYVYIIYIYIYIYICIYNL